MSPLLFDAGAGGSPPTILIVSHLAVAREAAAQVAGRCQDSVAAGRVDLLVYGRSSEQFPSPPGMKIVDLPDLSGSRARALARAARFLHSLRRRRYDGVAVGQPALALSRARGVIVSFPFLIGARAAVALDPAGEKAPRPLRRAPAYRDLVRWMALQAASPLIALTAARALRLVRRRSPGVPRGVPASGDAVYLRTDLELAAAPLEAGGSASHTEGVVRALARRGYDVRFWSTGRIAGMPSEIADRRLPVLLKGNLPTEIGELLSGLRQAVALRRRPAPQGLLYQRYSLNNLAGALLAWHWGYPLILEANASEARWREQWSALRYPALAHACEQLLLSRADLLTTVSQNAADGLLEAGAERERLKVVPNGVEVARFAEAAPRPLAFPAGSTVICFSGLFYPWHGVGFLAEAFSLVLAERPDCRLLLVGDGEERSVVEAILDRHGARPAALLTGLVPRDDVPGYLAAADILVSPHAPDANFVGSPIKVFEYMASGRPIVATRVGQLADALVDGETALLVEPGDPAAIASALVTLADDADLRSRLGDRAQEKARTSHSWDARLDALLGEDKKPLAGAPRRGGEARPLAS